MDRIYQEFYCGECDGYFRCKINVKINHGVKMVCPNCSHEHHRYIKNGVIFEDGRGANSPIEEIMPPKSSYYKVPFTEKMKKTKYKRDGVIIEDLQERSDEFLKNLWLERHGG